LEQVQGPRQLVGRVAAVLGGRLAALLGVAAGLGVYYAVHGRLWQAADWWDVAFLACVLIPACFACVWLALPLRTWRGLLPTALAIGVLAWALHVATWHTPENFSKLAGVTLLGFWFLSYFETVTWVVLVAAIIPIVDSYSVARGPTKVIVEHHEQVFTNLSFAFPLPGEDSAANLGLPDLLFFALFLAAAARFSLRPGWTWLAMVTSFGGTIALALSGALERIFSLGGLPALPLLSIAFLLVNADLLWRRLRPPAQTPNAPTVDTAPKQSQASASPPDRRGGDSNEGNWTASDLPPRA
jgi:uncharacterized membrane protein YjjB (DUF3815 family)